ncbi:MAG: sigma-54 interaction domain-containing protein, partial [Spirochaetota bacterium]
SLLSIITAMIAQAVQIYKSHLEENALLKEENRRLRDALYQSVKPSSIVGNSRSMRQCLALLEKVYNKSTPVLVLGESGTGKELIAQALHFNSERKDKPFVSFNCAALPENLAESELFGHEKGSFTGASASRKGKFEEADGGSIFLDEVGELSPGIQAKLLRVLQNGEVEKIGSNRPIKVRVRVICATHRDLPAMIANGEFREDLYYRINVFPITIPPLRERGSDILLLANHFVERYSEVHGNPVKRISSPAIDLLMSYHWPGNVRELENTIERAVILSEDGVIHSYHLPPSLQSAQSSNTKMHGTLQSRMDELEREMIVEALKYARGKMAKAARELGLTERVMALRLKKYNIDYQLYRGGEGRRADA